MADEAIDAAPAAHSGKGRMVPVLIVMLLMGAEGVGVFFLVKALDPPLEPVQAGGPGSAGDGTEVAANDDLVEIELAECRPGNMLAGKLISFHIRVSVLVADEDLERVQQLARIKRARLEDGVNTVIRSADPRHFNEPGLETIKRRLKHEFDRIFGDDELVKQVLVPHLLQSNSGV